MIDHLTAPFAARARWCRRSRGGPRAPRSRLRLARAAAAGRARGPPRRARLARGCRAPGRRHRPAARVRPVHRGRRVPAAVPAAGRPGAGFAAPFAVSSVSLRRGRPGRRATALPLAEIAERLELRAARRHARPAAVRPRRREAAAAPAGPRDRGHAPAGHGAATTPSTASGPSSACRASRTSSSSARAQIVTVARREPDDEYRRRLALYRPAAAHARALERSGGPADAGRSA